MMAGLGLAGTGHEVLGAGTAVAGGLYAANQLQHSIGGGAKLARLGKGMAENPNTARNLSAQVARSVAEGNKFTLADLIKNKTSQKKDK